MGFSDNHIENLEIDGDGSGSWEEYDINADTSNNGQMGWRGSPRYSDSPHAADQLPSVEQAKANAALSGNRNSRKWTQRQWLCMMLMIVLLFASLMAWKVAQGENQRHKQQIADAIALLGDVTNPEDFENSSSPQSQALEWIVSHDSMKKDVNDPNFLPFFVQRYIVAVFGMAVVPKSVRPAFHFFSNRHECEWSAEWPSPGNKKGYPKITMGIICDDDQNVVQINLQSIGLSGELPNELASLPYLTSLNLDINDLVGRLPHLPNVHQRVNLAYNQIDGDLDDAFFSEQLQELILSENLLEGSIPATMKSLTNLTVLALDGNHLTSGISNLFELYHLRELYLQHNELKDTLSNGSFQQLTRLKVLKAHNNRMSGPLPDALWTLSNLEVISLHSNALDGHVRKIQEGLSVKHLDVASNFLGGSLPEDLNLLTQLTYLDVSSNRFDVELPNLQALTNMETLLLTDNTLFGPQEIPEWLQAMTQLRRLSFGATGRTGRIPGWLSTLTSLELLDLEWNHISGTIPEDLSSLSSLQYLLLNRNWLDGTVPDGVSKMPSLKMFFIDNNRIVGNLDACQVDFLISDCGDPGQGCPDCPFSLTEEVHCPCCTKCCFDGNEYCNTDDWLSQILAEEEKDGSLDR